MSVDYSVLIVDSDNETQTELSEILTNKFNIEEVLTATDHQSAQNELDNRESIRCVIVSSIIDNEGAYNFISKIKQDEKLKDTKVLMLSEDSSRETLLQAAASGANELITKPISQRNVSLKLKRVFNVKEFRVTERISIMGALDAEIQFASGPSYQGKVIDISPGGCSIQTPILAEGGCVYDRAMLCFKQKDIETQISAELIRIEKDPETEESETKCLINGFRIKDLPPEEQNSLDQLLISLAQVAQ